MDDTSDLAVDRDNSTVGWTWSTAGFCIYGVRLTQPTAQVGPTVLLTPVVSVYSILVKQFL